MKTSFFLLSILGALALRLDAVPIAALPGRGLDAEASPGPDSPGRGGNSVGHASNRLLSAAVARAARLDEYAKDCVAQDPESSACLLTVEEFNKGLDFREVPPMGEDPGLPTRGRIDAIRGVVLRQILEEKYFTAYPFPARVRDSLSASADAAVFERNRASGIALGDSALRAAYRELYPAIFRGREESWFEVSASTDSLRLVSLRTASDSGARRPWPVVPESELPAEALRAVRSVKPGDVAGPVRVPFGYMFLRESSRRRRPDVPMAEALPLLISWASIPAGGDPGWRRDMEAYYRRHQEMFVTPDTITFGARLLPGTGRAPRSRRRTGGPMETDTSETQSITVQETAVQETDLPRSLREELSAFLPCRRGDLLGPIPSVFGTWYLRALEVRKGGRRLTLEESMPMLPRLVYGWDGPDSLVPAVADAQAREMDIRTAITAQYLMSPGPDNAAAGGMDASASGPTEAGGRAPAIPWESRRDDWMRNRLILRFVNLPDSGSFLPSNADPPLPDSAWSDGVGNVRSP